MLNIRTEIRIWFTGLREPSRFWYSHRYFFFVIWSKNSKLAIDLDTSIILLRGYLRFSSYSRIMNKFWQKLTVFCCNYQNRLICHFIFGCLVEIAALVVPHLHRQLAVHGTLDLTHLHLLRQPFLHLQLADLSGRQPSAPIHIRYAGHASARPDR